ncbi:MAG TPA: hypothetical protein VFY40_27545 [Blastocatellia bacterium]|nr:hypothetical protein [Blastocatellia bacterium]
MKSLLVGIKNVLLWSFSRGTWQYDALCLLIVLTVFLVPSRYFGDRDRAVQKPADQVQKSQAGFASKPGETYVEDAELKFFLSGRNQNELSQTPEEALRLYLRDKLASDVAIDELKRFTSPDGKVIYWVRFK